MLNLRPLFVQPSQVSRVCTNSIFVSSNIWFQGPSTLFVSVKSRTLILFVFVEILLVSSRNLVVGARAVLARSASFQTLPFGLINVDFDYFMLVVVTYLGMHLMISHGSPIVEQVSLINLLFLVMLFCFTVFIKPSRIPLVIILLPLSLGLDVIT